MCLLSLFGCQWAIGRVLLWFRFAAALAVCTFYSMFVFFFGCCCSSFFCPDLLCCSMYAEINRNCKRVSSCDWQGSAGWHCLWWSQTWSWKAWELSQECVLESVYCGEPGAVLNWNLRRLAEAEGLKRAEEAHIHHTTDRRLMNHRIHSPPDETLVQSYLAASLRLLNSAGADCEGETCWWLVLYVSVFWFWRSYL